MGSDPIVKGLSSFTKDPDKIIAEALGEKYKAYREKWRKASGLELVQDYPIHIDFELQFGCNLKCPQCIMQINPDEFGNDHPYHITKRKESISFDKFMGIIDEGVRYGLSSITLNVNNEPMLKKDLAKYVRYAADKGVLDIILLTNATMLTEERSQELLDSGLTKIYFSLDAVRKDTYEVVRKGADMDKVLKNIHYFLKLKKDQNRVLPVVRVSFIKCKANEAETEEFIRYWKDKVDFISIQTFVTPAYGYSNYDFLQDNFYIKNDHQEPNAPCAQPYQRLTIYNDGSVHPCCPWYGSMINVGNINRESIHSIWNSDKMKEIRGIVNSPDPKDTPRACQDCRKARFD